MKPNGTKQIHELSWDCMCGFKVSGGMDFQDLHAFNLALLSKQCWQLSVDCQFLLFHMFKAKYYPHENFPHA